MSAEGESEEHFTNSHQVLMKIEKFASHNQNWLWLDIVCIAKLAAREREKFMLTVCVRK
jgi:hypothetical protein